MRRATVQIALALLLSLVVIYQLDGTAMEEGDTVPNLHLPIAVLDHGTLSFRPEHFPELFVWKSKEPLLVRDDFFVARWHHRIGPKTTEEWRDAGKLVLDGPRYNVVESPRRNTYVSTFGPLPGLTFLPLVALLRQVDPEFGLDPLLQLSAAKLHGSLLVAASATLLFLTALVYTSRWRALFLALCYGLGTCAWAIASQNIWQQTANTFFLCAGCLFFLRRPADLRFAAAAGAAFGTAAACRSTSLVFLIAVAAYLAFYHRRSIGPFLAAAIPIPALIAVYNWYYFGSPLSFGQEIVGHTTALTKTGSPELWQTPLHVGALGLLVSPSRGLLVFSPFFAFAAIGVYRIWKNERYQALRPLSIATLLVMAIQCKWFDWWGGWAYGYRPWLDAVPLLTLFLLPVVERIEANKLKLGIFSAALAWSVFVQVIGAFAYDKSWNERLMFVARLAHMRKPLILTTQAEAESVAKQPGGKYYGPTLCNIDFAFCRFRLWSVKDSVIAYHVANFRETRNRRFPTAWKRLSLFRPT